MSTTAIVIIVVLAVVAIGLLAVFAVDAAKRRRLRSRFGPEYDHTLAASKDRRSAERELTAREKQHRQLNLRPLAAQDRERFTQQWAQVQEHFVDTPEGALQEAEQLVSALMQARGYPDGEFDQRVAHLSVEHGGAVGNYRDAHDIVQRHQEEPASTEDLRTALLHYRSLVEDLLKNGPNEHPDHDDERSAERV